MSFSSCDLPIKKVRFEWEIKNFVIVNIQKALRIESPTFTVEENGLWNWTLHLIQQEDHPYHVNCEILRRFCESDDHPNENVTFDCNLTLYSPDGSNLETEAKNVYLKGYQHYTFYNFFDLRDVQKYLINDNLNVICNISKSKEHYEPWYTRDCEYLSEEMRKLYNSALYSDLIIRTQKEKYRVHKFMLSIRWPGLEQFKICPSTLNVYLPCGGAEINTILQYVYSGKVDDEFIPMTTQKVALEYNFFDLVDEGKTYITQIDGITEIQVEQLVLQWELGNVWTNEAKFDTIRTKFKTLELSQSISINLSVGRCYLGDGFVKIKFKLSHINANQPLFLNCSVSVADKSNVINYDKKHHVFLSDKTWMFPPFINIDEVIDHKLIRNASTVKVTLDALFSVGKCMLSSTENYETVPKTLIAHTGIYKLSEDVKNLYKTGIFSDLTLHCQGQRFFAHSPIIAHHSSAFKKFTDITKPPFNISVKKSSASALEIILKYIYGVKVSEEMDEVVKKNLINVTRYYKFVSLHKKFTREFLKSIET